MLLCREVFERAGILLCSTRVGGSGIGWGVGTAIKLDFFCCVILTISSSSDTFAGLWGLIFFAPTSFVTSATIDSLTFRFLWASLGSSRAGATNLPG